MKIWFAGLVIVLGLATSSNSYKTTAPIVAAQETDPGLGGPWGSWCIRYKCQSAPPSNNSFPS
jgi:hypothetical protein